MSQTIEVNQQTLLGEDYLEIAIQSFLAAKTVEKLTKRTIEFCQYNLSMFVRWANSQSTKYVSQITPDLIRKFMLWISERHNDAGSHIFFRCLHVFLTWYWFEFEIDKPNPIDKIKTPKLPEQQSEGISKDTFERLLKICERGAFLGERNRAWN